MILGILASICVAASPAPDFKTVATMQQFLHHIIALQPMISSQGELKDPKKKAQARTHIRELARLAQEIDHGEDLKTAGRWISAKALQDHLKDLDKAFDSSGTQYTFRMLSATLGACASCHSQSPSKSLNWTIEGLLPDSMKALDRIEFLFATRHWDKAHQLIDHSLMAYPKPSLKLSELNRLLDLKVTFYLRVNRDLEKAVSELQNLFKNRALPESFRQRVSEQVFLLRALSRVKAPNPKKDSAAVLEAFAKNMLETTQEEMWRDLSDVHRATFLYVSGLLYEFMNERKPSQLSPGLYYWLSVCDDALNNQFFFGLADLYLKECVHRFPASKMARTCFDSYRERKEFAFTGTAGSNIPADVKADIEALRKKLK